MRTNDGLLTLDGRGALARYLARYAGRTMRASLHNVTSTSKSDGSVVTSADESINTFVVDFLAAHDPGTRVIGEESSSIGDTSEDCAWVVDPIDGTATFCAGVGLSTFAISYVERGEVSLSVVFDPWTDSLYEATIHSPTTRNGKVVSVSSTRSLADSSVAVEGDSRLYDALGPRVARRHHFGASVISGAVVAGGGIDALCSGWAHPWDVATSLLLIVQAGGVILSMDGGTIDATMPVGPFVAAGTQSLAEDLLDLWRTL